MSLTNVVEYRTSNWNQYMYFASEESISYFRHGDYHRDDGPALIWSGGEQYFMHNGKCFRVIGAKDMEW
jgi:hypothetical protein